MPSWGNRAWLPMGHLVAFMIWQPWSAFKQHFKWLLRVMWIRFGQMNELHTSLGQTAESWLSIRLDSSRLEFHVIQLCGDSAIEAARIFRDEAARSWQTFFSKKSQSELVTTIPDCDLQIRCQLRTTKHEWKHMFLPFTSLSTIRTVVACWSFRGI